MRVLVLLLASSFLTSCSSDMNMFPSGYKYVKSEYKLPPAEKANDLGYEYSSHKNEEIVQMWRIVAEDLIDTFLEETQIEPQSLYLEPAKKENAFYAVYDHVLRESLRERGFSLTTRPEDHMRLYYKAFRPGPRADEPANNTQDAHFIPQHGFQDYLFRLTAVKDDALWGQASGIYRVPTYNANGYSSDMWLYLGQARTHDDTQKAQGADTAEDTVPEGAALSAHAGESNNASAQDYVNEAPLNFETGDDHDISEL